MKKYEFKINKNIDKDKTKDIYPLGGFDISEEEVVGFIYDKSIKDTKIGLNTGSRVRNDKKEYAVFVNERFMKFLFEKEHIFVPLALRELAHVLNNDLEEKEKIMNDKKLSPKEIKDKLKEQEINADIFAAQQIGKMKMINVLDFLIREAQSKKAKPKEIKELENRKKIISKLED